MEIQIKTNLDALPSAIEFNYDELKSKISKKLEKYKNLVVTEDGIKAAKSDKADLNKLVTVIEDYRKSTKKKYLVPYESFETKCKDLVSLIKAPVTAIDTQIKEFEDAKKAEKYALLERYFEENVKELSGLVTLEKIVNPKWGNVSAKIDVLQNEIGDTLDRIRTDLDSLEKQYGNVPYKAAIVSEYCKGYNLSKTLVYAAQLEYEDKMQAKARDRAEHEEEPKCYARESLETVSNSIDTREMSRRVTDREMSCAVTRGTFRVSCTLEKLVALRDFMKENEIQFEVVK